MVCGYQFSHSGAVLSKGVVFRHVVASGTSYILIFFTMIFFRAHKIRLLGCMLYLAGFCLGDVCAQAVVPSTSIDSDEQSLAKLGALYPGGRDFDFIEGRGGRPAVKFFGMDRSSVIQIPNQPALQFTDAASFDVWVRIDADEGMNGLLATLSKTSFAMVLLAKSGDRVGFNLAIGPDTSNSTVKFHGSFGTRDQTWMGYCDTSGDFEKPGKGEWFRMTAVISRKKGWRIFIGAVFTK